MLEPVGLGAENEELLAKIGVVDSLGELKAGSRAALVRLCDLSIGLCAPEALEDAAGLAEKPARWLPGNGLVFKVSDLGAQVFHVLVERLDLEPRVAERDDVHPAVRIAANHLFDNGGASDSGNAFVLRQDNAKLGLPVDGRADHCLVAFLEDMQGKARARQEYGPQGEQGEHFPRHANIIVSRTGMGNRRSGVGPMRVLVFALALSAAWAAAQTGEEAFRQGTALFQQGRLAEAAELLRQAVEREPSARNWKAYGVALAAQADYRSAEPPLREACRLAPRDPDACYYLGRALYATDRYEESLEAMKKAESVHPRPWRVDLALGQAHEALGHAKEAEKHFQSAIRRAPPPPVTSDFDNPQVDYGLFLYRQGRLPEAIREYVEGMSRAPRSARARYQLGRALMQTGRMEEALNRLHEAIELEPGNREAHLALSRTYFRMGRKEDGERHSRLAAGGASSTAR